MHALEIVRGRSRDDLAGLDVPGQRHEPYVRMLDDRLARGHAVAGDDVQDAGRQDLRRELREAQSRQRRLLGRLQHLHVARGQRRGELPDRHHQRVVPRRDSADDPDRLTPQPGGVAAHVLAGRLAFEHAGGAGEEADVVGCDRNLVPRRRERLADVQRLELGDLIPMLVQRVRQLEQHLGALGGRGLQPLDEGLLRRLDRMVDVFGRCARHLGDHLAGRWVENLHGLAARSVDPLAADEVLVLGNGGAHDYLLVIR